MRGCAFEVALQFSRSVRDLESMQSQTAEERENARERVCARPRALRLALAAAKRAGSRALPPSFARWVHALFRRALKALGPRSEDDRYDDLRARHGDVRRILDRPRRAGKSSQQALQRRRTTKR
jgi:hypothetical protein